MSVFGNPYNDTFMSQVQPEPAVEFVNDWSELENAVEALRYDEDQLYDRFPWAAADIVVEFVPRLLTQYAKLLELSYVLTDLVEKQNATRPPTGLYLP